MSDELHPLPPLNDNYAPPQPWRCVTHAAHECTGDVVGALGAVPVCEPGRVAEIAVHTADRLLIMEWMNHRCPLCEQVWTYAAGQENWLESQ